MLPDTMTKTSDDISIQAEKDGETVTYSAEKMLVSIGRQANIEGIGLEMFLSLCQAALLPLL